MSINSKTPGQEEDSVKMLSSVAVKWEHFCVPQEKRVLLPLTSRCNFCGATAEVLPEP